MPSLLFCIWSIKTTLYGSDENKNARETECLLCMFLIAKALWIAFIIIFDDVVFVLRTDFLLCCPCSSIVAATAAQQERSTMCKKVKIL